MRSLVPAAAFLCCFSLLADVKPVPPAGVAISAEDKTALETGLTQLRQAIEEIRRTPTARQELLPDVQIFERAVTYALQYGEFFKPEEGARAHLLLQQGQERAAALLAGQAPWARATGLIVRGYVSKIDESIQPYGLVVPGNYAADRPLRWRLDTWFHGRNETLSEVNFLWDRTHNPGEFTPANTIVLHLYGRYCNANKLAGEVDLFEALDAVKRQYPIDENRIVVRGFSMGGAAAWHIATHYAGLWAAAAPGAGFSETPEFLRVWETEKEKPTGWEQTLWHLYNATDYAVNLAQCPTVAYSGEIDKQMQAATAMERALKDEGMALRHVIGPNTAHKYHPDAKVTINQMIDAIAEKGRDPYPRKLRFTTWTLAYNRMKWLVVDGLEQHWQRARVDAEILDDHTVQVKTSNVTALTLDMGSGGCPLDATAAPTVVLDGQKVTAPVPLTDRSWTARFRKQQGRWTVTPAAEENGLHKRHGLQGPVDDAFLERFVMVKPTGQPQNPETAAWVTSEQAHALREWRRQFRGEALVRNDADIDDAEIARSNLVLWGDPGSNRVLARIADKLPLRWTKEEIIVGTQRYPARTHALIMIFPNPLNPKKYVVLNSGFTYREYDYLNNARQVPKLPDYAVIDTTTPADERWPGKVVTAGFFNENWALR